MERRSRSDILREKVEELRKRRKPFYKSKTIGINSTVGLLALAGLPIPWYVSLGLVGANILLRSISTKEAVE